jgi:pentatricopeptide repeat protein
MPPNPTEDLGTEKDLLTWAVMSTETDKVFSGDWLGIDITFFRPDKVQPERYSKFMRDVFKKHISKVEQAIALNPMNGTLWNIWAWMAQCSPDYKISPFINSIEPGVYPSWNSNRTFPPRNVCAWIIEEAKAKNDWNTVVKFAKAAQYFRGAVPTGSSAKTEWSPNRITKFATGDETMKDYPARAYAAHLEALLRLGNIDEANRIYDEMIRKEGKTARFSTNIAVNGKTEWHKSENALIAANAARAVGMEDLAKIWEMGEQINKVPYVMNISDYVNGFPSWYYYAQSGKSYSDGFSALVSGLVPALRTYSAYPTIIDGVAILDPMASMGWKADDGDRWALIAGDMRAIEQGYGMPEPDTLQAMLKRHNVKDEAGYRRDYMAEHGARPGLEIDLAFTIIDSTSAAFSRRPDKGANIDKEQDVWAEACKLINKVLSENPEILINLPNTYGRGNSANSIQTPAMKALSTKLLANIEWLLEKKPSSENLWNQWLFWRWVEGSNRPIELIVESAVASPISIPGTVPPAEAMDAYYDECKKNEEWRKVISLLRVVWDREFARITDIQRTNPNFKVSAPAGNPSNFSSMAEYEAYLVQQWSAGLGDSVVIPLMEAYLHDSKPSDAKDIFDAWLGSGGTFKDISKVAELARKLGHERLAVEWEGKVKK